MIITIIFLATYKCISVQDNQSCLHIASMKGVLPIVTALVEAGADTSLQDAVRMYNMYTTSTEYVW